MELSSGSFLGPYEILDLLGAGGMGHVYRALDPRLGREIAIKVLGTALADDRERLRRFQLEARAVSATNHPNVLTIFDVGVEKNTPFLVTELLEGESLRELLEREGVLHPARALKIGAQIARGLAATHSRGIVHRDLKPANLFVTVDGQVKILDFGLARELRAESFETGKGDQVADTVPGTEPGTLLGTIGYMAPEQACGELVDEKSDLFGLGCVLYEALTGQAPFRRMSLVDSFGALLRDAPDWQALPPGCRDVREVLEVLLAKEPEDRRLDASNLAVELERLAARRSEAERVGPRRSRAIAVLLAIAATSAVGVFLLYPRSDITHSASSDVRAPSPAFQLVPLTSEETSEEWPALSPKGESVAFVRERSGVRALVLRDLSTGEDRWLTPGEYDVIQPSFFPSGEGIFYVRARKPDKRLDPSDLYGTESRGDIWRLQLATGRRSRVVEQAFHPDPSPDGSQLVVEADWGGQRRLWLVDLDGTGRRQLSNDPSEAISHHAPHFSPDGRHVVFQRRKGTRRDIWIVDLGSGRHRAITDDLFIDLLPDWSEDGRSILFSSNRGGALNVWRIGLSEEAKPIGDPEQLTQGIGRDLEIATGPSSVGVAFTALRENSNLWRLPLDQEGRPAGEAQLVVASTRQDSRGSWSPDDQRIAFNSDRDGAMRIWIHELTTGSTRRLTSGAGGDYQPTWSPDGETIAFFSHRSGSTDLWTVDVSSGELTRRTSDPGLEINPSFSPDGRYLAFAGDATSRFELWVLELETGHRRQISREGIFGHNLRWSSDGRSIYARCTCGDEGRVQRFLVADASRADVPEVRGGSHLNLLPNESAIIDLVEHRSIWLSPLTGGEPTMIYEGPSRLDYPALSHDGRWLLFDRLASERADVWLLQPLRPSTFGAAGS